jgi:hypothetical protein
MIVRASRVQNPVSLAARRSSTARGTIAGALIRAPSSYHQHRVVDRDRDADQRDHVRDVGRPREQMGQDPHSPKVVGIVIAAKMIGTMIAPASRT